MVIPIQLLIYISLKYQIYVYLEVDEEAVEFLFARAAVEVLAARVQQAAHEANAEEMLGRVVHAHNLIWMRENK